MTGPTLLFILSASFACAEVAKQADARDSKSRGGDTMPVRIRLSAPKNNLRNSEPMKSSADCVFCRIVAHELPAKRIDETDDIVVIQDIAPKAPIHYLIMPKEHFSDIIAIVEEQVNLFLPMMSMVHKFGRRLPGDQSFRLIFNNGREAGQSVFHLHAHFLAGKHMYDF